MPKFERHVFVCTNTREAGHVRGCCGDKQAVSVRESLKARASQAGLDGRVRVNTAGCLDQCEHGVTLVVYPEAVWYGFVTVDDVEEIVTRHLAKGDIVTRLKLDDACINTSSCPHRQGGTVRLGLG